jgi:hypothetical protein
MTVRESLHVLIDALPEDRLEVVRRTLIAAAGDPLLAALEAAPEDDEPLTAEETAEIDEALEDLRRGDPTIPLAEIKRKYGIAP